MNSRTRGELAGHTRVHQHKVLTNLRIICSQSVYPYRRQETFFYCLIEMRPIIPSVLTLRRHRLGPSLDFTCEMFASLMWAEHAHTFNGSFRLGLVRHERTFYTDKSLLRWVMHGKKIFFELLLEC